MDLNSIETGKKSDCETIPKQCNRTKVEEEEETVGAKSSSKLGKTYNKISTKDLVVVDENLNDSMEKCDVSPENSKKSCDVTPEDGENSLMSLNGKESNFLEVNHHRDSKRIGATAGNAIVAMETHLHPTISKQIDAKIDNLSETKQSNEMVQQSNINSDNDQRQPQNTHRYSSDSSSILSRREDIIPKSVSLFEVTNCDNNRPDDTRANEFSATAGAMADNKSLEESPKHAMAFTIDFGDGKSVDQQKYKNMFERFQNRHKRGVSMSKLEDDKQSSKSVINNNNNPMSTSMTTGNAQKPTKQPLSAKLLRRRNDNLISSFDQDDDTKVKLRDKSAHLQHLDNSKRHSWSPRSSCHDQPIAFYPSGNQKTTSTTATIPSSDIRNKFTPRSTTLAKILDNSRKNPVTMIATVTTTVTNRRTEVKSIDSPIDFVCQEPPLEHVKNSDEDSVSEAGTYTLDGDNYTEEQKERMNIDSLLKIKNKEMEFGDLDNDNVVDEELKINEDNSIEDNSHNFLTAAKQRKERPTSFENNLEIIDLELQPNVAISSEMMKKRKNVLEISFCHDSTNVKPKISYLEKIKSRVKNIGEKTFHKSKSPEKLLPSPDVGTFTSVTTSGILSFKPTLESNPRLTRKNSLTKSQIDNSEYVQGKSRVNLGNDEKILNSITDSDKLQNILSSSENEELSLNNSGQSENEPPTGSAIKSAVTKNDWIQEWAKNARKHSAQMSRSYTGGGTTTSSASPPTSARMSTSNQFDGDDNLMTKSSDYYYDPNYEEFGDNLDKNHYRKNIDRYRYRNIGEIEYSSDPNLKFNNSSTNFIRSPTHNLYHSPAAQIRNSTRRKYANEAYNNDDYLQQQQQQGGGYNELSSPNRYRQQQFEVHQYEQALNMRPPMSPSKIPSPVHSIGRARNINKNRSLHGSNTDLATNDTEMYLQKTAAAISTLQNIHRNSLHNSPQSPSSPVHKISPKISPVHSLRSPMTRSNSGEGGSAHDNDYSPIEDIQLQMSRIQQLHKRNLSLDGTETYPRLSNYSPGGSSGGIIVINPKMSHSYNFDGLNGILDLRKHSRHHSYEGMCSLPPHKPLKAMHNFDQTGRGNYSNIGYDYPHHNHHHNNHHHQQQLQQQQHEMNTVAIPRIVSNKQTNQQQYVNKSQIMSTSAGGGGGVANRKQNIIQQTNKPIQNSPIRRSSSFSVKPMTSSGQPVTSHFTPKLSAKVNNKNSIQKSASSTSFKKLASSYNDNDPNEFYINDDDDLEPGPFSSDSDFSGEYEQQVEKEPITNTRYNKAFLMRLEQNKRPTSTSGGVSGGGGGGVGGSGMTKQGVVACPNTPELPRRDTSRLRASLRDRASMPRDSSLGRMKQDISNLSSAKKSLTQTSSSGSSGSKISQQQTPQQQQQQQQQQSQQQKVLPKYMDISKYKSNTGSNFLKKDESKSYLLNKEVKRSPSSASVTLNRADPSRVSNRSVKSAGARPAFSKKDQQAQKIAKETELAMWRRRASYDPMKAAMEGKKKQEEARRLAQQQQQQQSKLSESSTVLRSQSFHSGVGQCPNSFRSGANNLEGNRWTLTSNESSDDDYTTNS